MSSDELPAPVILSDRRYWTSIQVAWQEGLTALCPLDLDTTEAIAEWRSSARRLATHLECRVQTGLRTIRISSSETQRRYVAVGNDGYPLGLTDPYARDAWMRQRAEADEG